MIFLSGRTLIVSPTIWGARNIPRKKAQSTSPGVDPHSTPNQGQRDGQLLLQPRFSFQPHTRHKVRLFHQDSLSDFQRINLLPGKKYQCYVMPYNQDKVNNKMHTTIGGSDVSTNST